MLFFRHDAVMLWQYADLSEERSPVRRADGLAAVYEPIV
jgi:hypothetical protein